MRNYQLFSFNGDEYSKILTDYLSFSRFLFTNATFHCIINTNVIKNKNQWARSQQFKNQIFRSKLFTLYLNNLRFINNLFTQICHANSNKKTAFYAMFSLK